MSVSATELRRKAEETLKRMGGTDLPMSELDMARLLHELQVYQIELEIQNEELQRVREDLEYRVAERTNELRESEERFRSILQTVPGIAVQGYAPDGTTKYWNHASETLYGYNVEEAIGCNLLDLIIPPEMRREVEHAMKQMAETGQPIPASELLLMRKDGSRVAVFSSHAIVRIPGYEPELLCLDVDLTQRKKAEDILKAKLCLSEFSTVHTLDELLQLTLDEAESLTESTIGFLHFVDEDQNTLSLQMWSTNTTESQCKVEGVRRHCDVKSDGVLSECMHQLRPVIHNDISTIPQIKGLPPGHASILRELLVPVIRDNCIVAAIGVGNKPTDYSNQDIGTLETLANLAWNIVEHMRTEEALRLNEERLSLILMGSSDALWDWNLETNSLYYSPRWWEMVGYESGELPSDAALWRRLTHPDDSNRVEAYFESVLRNGPDVYEVEFRLRNKNGRYVPVLSRGIILRNEAGHPIRVSGTNTDITQRKLSEEALAQAAERDHHIAEVFQRTVMPTHLPELPPNYEIATKYQPASMEADVCGDFYDIFDCGEGAIGISFGDIVGKGLLAAMRVTAAKNMIRSYAFLNDRPSNVMSLVNDALCRDIAMENDMLMAFFAILDTCNDNILYSNAGHEPGILRHHNGFIELLNLGGPMFCGMGKQTYLEGCVHLQAGDVFVMVTDGITEASIDKRSDQFGTEGVIRCLSTNAGAPAEQIAEAILEDATKTANGLLRDDASILVIKKL